MTLNVRAEHVSLKQLGACIGTQLDGLDLANIDGDQSRTILRTLAERPVLVFRNQNLGPAHIAALGRRLGKPRPHILLNYRVKNHPEVSMVTNVDATGKIDPFGVSRAITWHTDMTYWAELPMLGVLHALEVPAVKGGTMFTDMRAAYDALPASMKGRLQSLTALHDEACGPQGYRRGKEGADPLHDGGDNKAQHPAVRMHPVSGRPVLFVNPTHTIGFAEMEPQEGFELVKELAEHSTQDRFVYYHQWRPGDVVMWDETSTMHRNAGDSAATDRRIFLRTIVFAA